MIKEKILEITQQKALIQELQNKVKKLEEAVNYMTAEFKIEIKKTEEKALVQNQAARTEIEKLEQLLEMKEREMSRVKKLARNILNERTEVEKFFLDALEQVKQEIISSRKCYKQVAQAAYQRKMMAAFAGKEEYPKIRTFNDSAYSTNSVQMDLLEAEKWYMWRNFGSLRFWSLSLLVIEVERKFLWNNITWFGIFWDRKKK